ncbi:helix-turn-helix transcriptional regulator [Halopseudomonas sp.]|uniref:helix-turn-helix transcriptional regulator n=1 Tax=Halopseudomonas sp. TaxID=2901191 RepID=UPI0030038865
MSQSYQVFSNLQQHKAQLQGSAQLSNGLGLARWYNDDDLIALGNANHHTLSVYLADGFQSYFRTPDGWRNGGAPDKLCLMPKDYASTWHIRGPLSFMHLYFTDQHLRQQAEQTWDRSPAQLTLDERLFADDPQIALLYRHFLLNHNWQDPADRLAISSATTLILNHLLKHYVHLQWQAPAVRGGLSPYQLKRVTDYIDEHLDQPLLLQDLAGQVSLSEYHFARMFKHSKGVAPHQYVMNRRLARAMQLLRNSPLPLTSIALQCGFSSPSHFSNRFRQVHGCSPSALRAGH